MRDWFVKAVQIQRNRRSILFLFVEDVSSLLQNHHCRKNFFRFELIEWIAHMDEKYIIYVERYID